MKNNYLSTNDVIVACATPPGNGALAIIRLSGNETISLLCRRFSQPSKLMETKGNTVVYGHIIDKNNQIADEVTVCVFRKPKSYTGEESADIICHGSSATVDAVLSACESAGARQAMPGEFSFRAFINGKMDLSRAEAVNELSRAKSSEARHQALDRLSGKLAGEISELKIILLEVLAAVEVKLDYGEDEIDDDLSTELNSLALFNNRLEVLIKSWRLGRLVDQGVNVVVTGKTNAGKSSLFNYLLKEERAIVSDIHGTTRDYLEAMVDLKGMPVKIFDTAGLRKSDDPLELEGIKRSRKMVQEADVILYLQESTSPFSSGKNEIQELLDYNKPVVFVWTKIDLEKALPAPEGWVEFSSITGEGLGNLENSILEHLGVLQDIGKVGLRISSDRQKRLIENAGNSALEAMQGIISGSPMDAVALDLRDAVESLGEILGENLGDGILETIFSKFCVGK